jgi:hypothetical protein
MNRRSFLKTLVPLPLLSLAISQNSVSAKEIEVESKLVWTPPTDTSTPTAMDRVNTQRLALYIRKTYATLINELQGNPNDTKTRAFIHSSMTGVMEHIRSGRGIYDYVVVCDESNNPPSVITQGGNRVDIAFKQTPLTEFVYLPLGHGV